MKIDFIEIYKKIFLVVMPFVILILVIPTDKRARYVGLQDYCFHQARWLHDRIHVINTPIDIAFIGSSHVKNGINDKLIDSLLAKEHKGVVALGICEYGRDVHLEIVKDLIDNKQPKKVVLEIRDKENKYGHPVFPHLASTSTMLSSFRWNNLNYYANLKTHFLYKMELLQGECYGRWELAPFYHNYGFISSDDTIRLEESFEKKRKIGDRETSIFESYSQSILIEIRELCRINNIELSFLYLPKLGAPDKPANLSFYESLGSVMLPPKSIFNDRNNYYDTEHLNVAGAEKLALWLAQDLNSDRN